MNGAFHPNSMEVRLTVEARRDLGNSQGRLIDGQGIRLVQVARIVHEKPGLLHRVSREPCDVFLPYADVTEPLLQAQLR